MLRDLLGGYVDAARLAAAPYMATIRAVVGAVLLIASAVLVWRIAVWHGDHLRVGAMEDELKATKAELAQYRESSVAAAEAYVGEIARVERVNNEERRHAQEQDASIRRALDQSDRAARDLARRLRDYQARSCGGGTVSFASGPSFKPAAASGEPSDGASVDGRVEAHFAACARDAERLDGWRSWWAGVVERWKAAGYPVEGEP